MCIKQTDIVKIVLEKSQVDMCKKHAQKAMIGGHSWIREDREERMAQLGEDQLVGQLGEAALFLWLFGNLDWYDSSRTESYKKPGKGDKGQDVPGYKVDIKTSLMRKKPYPLDYHLFVAPREWHPGWAFVSGLVESTSDDEATVLLCGWARSEFMQLPDTHQWFKGTYWLPVSSLSPMTEFQLEDNKIQQPS